MKLDWNSQRALDPSMGGTDIFWNYCTQLRGCLSVVSDVKRLGVFLLLLAKGASPLQVPQHLYKLTYNLGKINVFN